MSSLVPEHNQWAFHPKSKKEAMPEPIDLLELEQSITMSRLDRIAEAIRGLTYGQMITMAVELGSLGPITKDTIANVLWEWSVANAEANAGRVAGVDGTGEGSLLPGE